MLFELEFENASFGFVWKEKNILQTGALRNHIKHVIPLCLGSMTRVTAAFLIFFGKVWTETFDVFSGWKRFWDFSGICVDGAWNVSYTE